MSAEAKALVEDAIGVVCTQAKLDPNVGPSTITIFDSKEDQVTVIWTEGLKSLPAEYATK